MKPILLAIAALVFFANPIQGQSCFNATEIKSLQDKLKSAEPVSLNKKLQSELQKMAEKQVELLTKVIDEDQKSESSRTRLREFNEKSAARLCELIKLNGWPTSALVEQAGVLATYHILKNCGSYELQRDLLPVIIAASNKDPVQKPEFAGIFDRLRVSAGMKQLFGTQAVSVGGFLVLYPIENEAKVDDLRKEFGLVPLKAHLRNLERTYNKPLIRSRQQPESQVEGGLKNSLTNALESSKVDPNYVAENDVIRVETNLVNLNVSVFNKKVQTFDGSLTKDDFKVMENGHPETVTFFSSNRVPFDLVLLVDLSGSTSTHRDLIKKSTLRFIEAARPSDRLAIVTFSTDQEVVCPLTLDREKLVASVKNMNGTGGSNIWDAVKFTLDSVIGPRTVERRRAVVLITDGLDNSSVSNSFLDDEPTPSGTLFADLLEQVRQTDALIISVDIDSSPTFMKGLKESASKMLRLLADESGGSYYVAHKLSDLNGVYGQVINDLGQVYSLGYTPTNEKRDGRWRWVEIQVVNKPDLTTRSRPGYYAQ